MGAILKGEDGSSTAQGYLHIAVGIVLAGSSAIFIRKLSLPATVIVAAQAAIALPFMTIFFIRRPRLAGVAGRWPTAPSVRTELAIIIAMGVLLALANFCFTLGVQKTRVANIVMLAYLYPLFTSLLSVRILGERVRPRLALALGLGMGGTLLVLSSNLGEFDEANQVATALGIVVAVFVATRRVLAKKLSDDVSTMAVVAVATAIVALAFLPSLVISHYSLTWSDAVVLFASAIVTNVVASWLTLSGVRKLDANPAAALSYLEPLSAVVFAWVFLSERPGLLAVGGGALIGCSAYLAVRGDVSGRGAPPQSRL